MPKTTVPDPKGTPVNSSVIPLNPSDPLSGSTSGIRSFLAATPNRPSVVAPKPVLDDELERRRREEMLEAVRQLYVQQRAPMYTAKPFSPEDLTPELLHQLNSDYVAARPNVPNLNVKNLAKVRK